jgi:hypothetical protein
MDTAIRHIDFSLYEHLRRRLVELGYLPDVSVFDPEDVAGYEAAKAAIVASGREVVEVFPVGFSRTRGEMQTHRIVINRADRLPGNVGYGQNREFVPQYDADGNLVGYNAYDSAGTSEQLQYEFRLVSQGENQPFYDRLMSDLVLTVFSNLGHVELFDADTLQLMPGGYMLLQKANEPDVGYVEVGERVVRYYVQDVATITPRAVPDRQGVSPLKRIDLSIFPTDTVDGNTPDPGAGIELDVEIVPGPGGPTLAQQLQSLQDQITQLQQELAQSGGNGTTECNGVPVCDAIAEAASLAEDASDDAATALAAAGMAQSTADTAVGNAAAAQSTADTAVGNAAAAQSTADTAVGNAATALAVARANARTGGYVWGTPQQSVVPYCPTQIPVIASAANSWLSIQTFGQIIAFRWGYDVQQIQQIEILVRAGTALPGALARLVMARINTNNQIIGPALVDATYALDVPGLRQLLLTPIAAPLLGENIALVTLANAAAAGASTNSVAQDWIDNGITGTANYTAPNYQVARSLSPGPGITFSTITFPNTPAVQQASGYDRVPLYNFTIQ